jgi:hypothetical protein
MLLLRKGRGLEYDHVELQRVSRSLKNNPVKQLVDAGQFSAIIEETEVELEDSNNMFESLGEKISSFLPKQVNAVIDVLYLNKDTKAFKMIMKTVQYSDFVGKYAYVKYLTEKKGVSTAEAINTVERMFINYALLQNKYMKYGGDMGGFRFTKYLFRVQYVIAKMLVTKPSSTISSIILQKLTTDISDITDTALPITKWAYRLGDPVKEFAGLSHPHLLEFVDLLLP